MEAGHFARAAAARPTVRESALYALLVGSWPVAYAVASLACCLCAQWLQDVDAVLHVSGLLELLSTGMGQLCVVNLCVSALCVGMHALQRAVFGKLRAIEWQRLWDRLLSFLMGQLVVLGAVVEPDVAELALWGGFSTFVGLLSLSAGAQRSANAQARKHC